MPKIRLTDELIPKTEEGIVTRSEYIYDTALETSQSEINAALNSVMVFCKGEISSFERSSISNTPVGLYAVRDSDNKLSKICKIDNHQQTIIDNPIKGKLYCLNGSLYKYDGLELVVL